MFQTLYSFASPHPRSHPFPCAGIKNIQFNIELDHASHVNFTQDGRACVVGLAAARRLRILKVDVKGRTCESKGEIPEPGTKAWPGDVLGCGIHAANPTDRFSGCSYVASATNGTTIEFRTIKGDLMESIDTKNGGTSTLSMSPVRVPAHLYHSTCPCTCARVACVTRK